MLSRASHKLSRVRFFHSQNLGDLAVRIVKGFPQNVGGALCWRKLFQQHKNRKPQRLVTLWT
jgi:hypothetical protein